MILNEKAQNIVNSCQFGIHKWKKEQISNPDGSTTSITWCNAFVSYVASECGYHEFKGLMANQIIDHMVKSGDFAEVFDAEAIKNLADDGRLVIAGRKDNPHGHVAPVCPGYDLVFSSKWKKLVPTVANSGETNGTAGENWFFGSEPRHWVLI